MATMSFSGCSEEIKSEIVLPLRATSPPLSKLWLSMDTVLNLTLTGTPTSSLFSPQQNSPSSSQEGNFMTNPLSPPTNTRLGWPCHVATCTCHECSPDYDHLSSLEEFYPTSLVSMDYYVVLICCIRGNTIVQPSVVLFLYMLCEY